MKNIVQDILSLIATKKRQYVNEVRFDDDGFSVKEGKTLYSTCNIDSKEGNQYISNDAIHQNCAGCFVPHSEVYIKKYFNRNWFLIMGNVIPYGDK